MKKHFVRIAATFSLGLIAGCGGGGSGQATSTTVSGSVADGYLAGATVFLDKNGNYMWDAGEPTTVTDASGAYTLTMDPSEVGRYPIVALALKGVTSDSDSGVLLNSYVLSMPKDSVTGTVSSNFISPMSTQIRELMATGQYTMGQAMDQMRALLKLPAGTNLMANYMTTPGNATSQAMHTAAQNMASLMGSQMTQVLSSSGPAPGVDVNRYRGMMGAIFSNISSIKGPGANPDTKTAMTNLMGTMTANLPGIVQGQPYRNMSTFFKGGMGTMGTGTRNPGMGS
jgi:hypothetical protein